MKAPNLIQLLDQSFVQSNAYAQISYIDTSGYPVTKTAHVHYLDSLKMFVFNTHRLSNKCKMLKKNKKIGVCFWDEKNGVQIYFNGTYKIIEDQNLKKHLWLSMREQVRMAYMLDQKGWALDLPNVPQDLSLEHPSIHHVLLAITPKQFDVFCIHPQTYRFSKRYIYKKNKGEQWIGQEICILHHQKVKTMKSSKPNTR